MSYAFTGPDVIMTIIITVVVTTLILHRPRGHEAQKTTCYKIGINAIRLAWGGGLGPNTHEIKIQLSRRGDAFPTVGDILAFTETDQGVWRGTVSKVKLFTERGLAEGSPKPRPSAIVTVSHIK